MKLTDIFEGSFNALGIDALIAQADRELDGEAARAIDGFVGMPHDAIAMGMDFGIMQSRILEDAFSQSPSPKGLQIKAEIEQAFAPVKEALRKQFGDTITLYRGQGKIVDGKDRNVLSWTTDPNVAKAFVGVQKHHPLITDEQIKQALEVYQKTGRLKFGSNTYIRVDDEYYNIYSGNDHITDGDDLEADLRSYQEWRQSIADKNAKKERNIFKRDIPLDAIVWTTHRANQSEFIVRNIPGTSWYIPKDYLVENSRTVKLTDIYDENELDDESEALYHFTDIEDRNRDFIVHTMTPKEAKTYTTSRNDMTVLDAFKAYATKAQKALMKTKMMKYDHNRIIVVMNKSVIDGNHHLIAGIMTNQPIKYIDLADFTLTEFRNPPIRKKSRLAAPDTEAFRSWFAGSKAVDRAGNPLVVYHGTYQEIDAFKAGRLDLTFFSTDAHMANTYASNISKKRTSSTYEGGNVMPCYIRVLNPYDFRTADNANLAKHFLRGKLGNRFTRAISYSQYNIKFALYNGDRRKVTSDPLTVDEFAQALNRGLYQAMEIPEFLKFLKIKGYDAIVTHEGKAINYGIFDPKQAKSVFSKSFNPKSKKISENN